MQILFEFLILDTTTPKSAALCCNPDITLSVFINVDYHSIGLANTLEMICFTVIKVQSVHRPYPYPTALIGIKGIATRIIKRMRIRTWRVLAQGTRLYIQHLHTISISTYPEFVAAETKGMGILASQYILVWIIYKTILSWRIAHQSTIVAGNPDTFVFVFAKMGDDVASQACLDRKGVKALTYRRYIGHAAIKSTYPESPLAVTSDGIDKTIGQAALLQQTLPCACLRIKTDESVVAANTDTVVRTLVKRMDMRADFR